MSEIELSLQQEKVVKSTFFWYNFTDDPYYIIGGYAGTGKSFITKYIIEQLNLEPYQIIFCAYTGKATSVMIKKGNNGAQTIHKAFYNFYKEVDDKGNEVFKFAKKNEISPLVKLIVIDEFSMVPDNIMQDILSFGVKVLCLCDPGQLPPVKGTNSYMKNINIVLDEIFRQDDSNLIRLSFDIRKGKRISLVSDYGKFVKLISQDEFDRSDENVYIMDKVEQVLCGKNDTRNTINTLMREYLGYESELPCVNDKLVVTRNDYSNTSYSRIFEQFMPVINGMIGFSKYNVEPESINYQLGNFSCSLLTDDMDFLLDVDYYNFINKEVPKKVYWARQSQTKVLNLIDYGYALTVHKSQGSQFNSVLVYNERIGSYQDYLKWLYTAVTRVEKKLIMTI